MRLSPDAFGQMTLVDFGYALEGFQAQENEEIDRENFNHRRVCHYLIGPHLSEDDRRKGIAELLWSHPWDEELEKHRVESLPVVTVIVDEQ